MSTHRAHRLGHVTGAVMGDPIGSALDFLHGIFVWFQTVVPGGFGLLLLPLGALALVSLWAARH